MENICIYEIVRVLYGKTIDAILTGEHKNYMRIKKRTRKNTFGVILHTVHTVHVPCFPVSDVEVSSSTSVHTLVLTYKFTCVFTYHSCSHHTYLN
jgi:hypothetical protein